MSLKGKTLFITGGSRGIGLAIADLLMEAGLPEGTLSVLPGPGSTTATARARKACA